MKKNLYIDDEEKDLIESFEKGDFISSPKLEERKKILQNAFKTTYTKRKAINIRLLEKDIQKIKSKAIEEGLPYQTLIAQVLHKYSTGKIILK